MFSEVFIQWFLHLCLLCFPFAILGWFLFAMSFSIAAVVLFCPSFCVQMSNQHDFCFGRPYPIWSAKGGAALAVASSVFLFGAL